MEEFHRYIYFYTVDYKGEYNTNGYTLPITPFTFIPVFDDGLTQNYSKQKILWDFGDGTTSTAVTATHSFKLPGWYNVTCHLLGKDGKSYLDSFSQSILVKDFITDTIVVSGVEYKTESGLKYPFTIYRFNSWQSYPVLSAEGYTINLNVSGNVAQILNTETYKTDKWGHLKPYAKFETNVFNPITNKIELTPVNSIVTDKDTNKEIYVKLLNNKVVFCEKGDVGSCFAGTSGSKLAYYTDDTPKVIPKTIVTKPSILLFSFDKKKFIDHDNYNINYPDNLYPVLNGVYDYTIPSSVIEQINPYDIAVTSNGIDIDNLLNRIHTFDIYKEKFTNQKIPFVARLKDKSNLTLKYNPILKLYEGEENLQDKIKVYLKDKNNNTITDGVSVFSNFGILSSEKYGGYFKGYLISSKPYYDVNIYVESYIKQTSVFYVDTIHAVIAEPQADKIHSLKIIAKNIKKDVSDTIANVSGLTGIYSSCMTCERLKDSTKWCVWVVDADREKILKLNPDNIVNGNMEVLYSNFVLPDNSSPSNICSDKNGNVWVTLYDSISTVRINNISNLVDTIIVPSVSNSVIDYENTVTPACVDTDINNNVWVSYSNQLSSFIEKYDSSGSFLNHVEIISGYQCTEILTDLNSNLWGIAKDLKTTDPDLTKKSDKIFKIDTNNNITYYSISGSLWNLTLDISGNIWTTKNINEVSRFKVSDQTIDTIILESNSVNKPNNYISDLEGITCTTDDTILVIDNINRKLHYFSASIIEDLLEYPPELVLSGSFVLNDINGMPLNRIQDKINGYGDWNGFKHINKFQRVKEKYITLQGNSNVFTIYDSNKGQYDLRKINENFDPSAQLNSYKFQDYLLDKSDSVFKLIETFIGTLSSTPNYLGKLIYERISNFTDNIANVDTCTVKSLKSMYNMLDEDFYTFGNSDVLYPAELNRLVDIFSVNFSKLKGSRNKFDQNFDSKGYYNEMIIENGGTPIYGNNKGKELDFFTSVLSSGKDIVAFEKFSQQYKLLNTNLDVTSAKLTYIDPINKTYALSGLNEYWGWGLSLPDDFNVNLVPRYYSFYEYMSGFNNNQTEGIINWSDEYTTISENISSVEDWHKIQQNIINYALAKGLALIK